MTFNKDLKNGSREIPRKSFPSSTSNLRNFSTLEEIILKTSSKKLNFVLGSNNEQVLLLNNSVEESTDESLNSTIEKTICIAKYLIPYISLSSFKINF